MRALAFVLASLVLATPVAAKTKRAEHATLPKPPIVALHDRPAACRRTYDGELTDVRNAASKEGWKVYPINGNDVSKFLDIFNSTEPKTNYKAEQILVVSLPEFAYVELFHDGCVNHYGKLPPVAFETLMTQAFGDDVVGGEWM